MHSLVKRIFNSEIHLPSAEKLWHIPDLLQFPIPVPSPRRSTPLEVHATSYLAASVRILSLSYNVISVCILSVISFSRPSVSISNICSIQILAHMFDFFNCFRQKNTATGLSADGIFIGIWNTPHRFPYSHSLIFFLSGSTMDGDTDSSSSPMSRNS